MKYIVNYFSVILAILFCWQDISFGAINTSRPRVWIDATIKTSIEQQVISNTVEWQNLKSWCDQYVGANLNSGYRGQQWHKAVLNYALAFQATGSQTYGNEGVKYLTALIDDHYNIGDGLGGDARFANDDGGGNAFVSRFVGVGASIGRDWLDGATNLDVTLINRVGARIAYWLNYLKTASKVYAFHDPYDNFWAGHFAFFYTSAISIYGDKNYNPTWYTYSYETMWGDEVLPVIQTFFKGGDWQEGFSYGPLAMRNIFLFQHAVETGTDVSILSESDWNKEIIRSQIHMLHPGRDYVSDDGSWSGNYKGDPRRALILAAASMGNTTETEKGLAKWYTEHLDFEPVVADQWELFLWRIDAEEVEPTATNMGGLSYLTRSSRLLARSAPWSNQNATYVDFHAGPTGAVGNGERNAGEFKIASRGEILVIDGDTYQDESQYANVLLINGSHTYAPKQEWWKPNTSIDRYQETPSFTYARASRLDNAYDGNLNNMPSVSFYSRELLFVYPDYVFVMDSVVPTAQTTNTIISQVHMRGEPELSGSTATVTQGNVKLFMDIRGHDISLAKANEPIAVRGTVWNVKISPNITAPNYKLLHVFQTADSSKISMDTTEEIITDKLQGVHIGNIVALFNKDHKLSDMSGNITFTFTGTADTYIITGLKPSTRYNLTQISAGDETNINLIEGEGSYIVSEKGVLSITTSSNRYFTPTIKSIKIN